MILLGPLPLLLDQCMCWWAFSALGGALLLIWCTLEVWYGMNFNYYSYLHIFLQHYLLLKLPQLHPISLATSRRSMCFTGQRKLLRKKTSKWPLGLFVYGTYLQFYEASLQSILFMLDCVWIYIRSFQCKLLLCPASTTTIHCDCFLLQHLTASPITAAAHILSLHQFHFLSMTVCVSQSVCNRKLATLLALEGR